MAGGAPGNSQIVVLALKNRSRAAHGWHHDSLRIEHSLDGALVVSGASASTVLDVASMSVEDRAALRDMLRHVTLTR